MNLAQTADVTWLQTIQHHWHNQMDIHFVALVSTDPDYVLG